ncbi:hypothetical protein SKAU_G00252640 [Synaphobranchus kaupii]|uniref:Uncharacterized protein n=1 Tax=Synaphobranchus kaupii TaxID=118154 RepID=A0A9Q1IPY4_SYNKA|nr:hypothetical protein SKAU_G00252640 [Synaphobranchus kaupii]
MAHPASAAPEREVQAPAAQREQKRAGLNSSEHGAFLTPGLWRTGRINGDRHTNTDASDILHVSPSGGGTRKVSSEFLTENAQGGGSGEPPTGQSETASSRAQGSIDVRPQL